jgi:acyl-coenzyme A thioesterase PaaI-like protein
MLLVDAPDSNLLLTMRTGKQTAGHPGWTHGGFTSLLMDEMAGQAYAEFIQPERGPGMTANLTVNYTAPLPTEADLLVMAGVERVVGLYKLNPVDPQLESARFQPLKLEPDM